MNRLLLSGVLAFAFGVVFWRLPDRVLVFFVVLGFAFKIVDLVTAITDLILGCEDDPDPSNSRPMTANIPAESAKALGLTAPGDEAYIEVTEVNSDGSVVVMSEMEDVEEAAPPPAPAASAMPAELGKMLGS